MERTQRPRRRQKGNLPRPDLGHADQQQGATEQQVTPVRPPTTAETAHPHEDTAPTDMNPNDELTPG